MAGELLNSSFMLEVYRILKKILIFNVNLFYVFYNSDISMQESEGKKELI